MTVFEEIDAMGRLFDQAAGEAPIFDEAAARERAMRNFRSYARRGPWPVRIFRMFRWYRLIGYGRRAALRAARIVSR